MAYRGVCIKKDGDLTHWKYIDKKKINGKWRYFYYDKDKKSVTLSNGVEGPGRREVTVKNTDKLVGGGRAGYRTNRFNGGKKPYYTNTTYEFGQLQRAISKGKAWLEERLKK